jgi:hypothetical protein
VADAAADEVRAEQQQLTVEDGGVVFASGVNPPAGCVSGCGGLAGRSAWRLFDWMPCGMPVIRRAVCAIGQWQLCAD